ncbi:MAG TPA: sulfate transporter family protein [Xanthobacteraceae bacterium]|nr:sulfate transporter family protein [Xanthobacteraceae bacterium]
MLTAAAKAFAQMWSPRFRAVLFKSAGLALVILIVLGVVLQRLLAWLVQYGRAWLETTFASLGSGVIGTLELILAVIASLGVIAAMIFLMPAATALVAGIFADDIAETVERTHYPAAEPGKPLPLTLALAESVKTALLGVLVYLCAVPFLLFAGLGLVVFFVATAFLLSREYFHLAAMRFRSRAEARAMRRRHGAAVFLAGLPIAALVSIPILNLATPLFATALMVHMHKRLSESEAGSAAQIPGGKA